MRSSDPNKSQNSVSNFNLPDMPPSYNPINPLPATDPDYARQYQEATKRVQKKMNFYKSLTSYLIVVAFLWAIYLITSPGAHPWPIWVMLGWGVGLAFQGMEAFSFGVSSTQRQRMIDDELHRMGR